MTKFKKIISEFLENNSNIENTIENISQVQQNILKNYSNPVFSSEDKNKLLNKYSELENVGKSLYRYNSLTKNNIDADSEKENISNIVLKGGISNTKYVWHSENTPHTCQKCKDLDGTEYDFEDEVPERPHPNCKCHVEIIDDNTENIDIEPCDCYEKIETILEETEELQAEIEPMAAEIETIINEVEADYLEIQELKAQVKALQQAVETMEPCGENCIALTGFAANLHSEDRGLEIKIYNIAKHLKPARETYLTFLSNKYAMENEAKHTDKYYHAKANCESAELGTIQALFAICYSIAKELKDYYHKVKDLHMDEMAVFKDCMEDLHADLMGLLKAYQHGYCGEKVLEVEKMFKK